MSKYDDIISLPHHVSQDRPHMSRAARAAQFAPFAALTGYHAAIDETARMTETEREQDGDGRERLDGVLQSFLAAGGGALTVVYFAEDARKAGGQYMTYTGVLRRVDGSRMRLDFADGTSIDMARIADLYF